MEENHFLTISLSTAERKGSELSRRKWQTKPLHFLIPSRDCCHGESQCCASCTKVGRRKKELMIRVPFYKTGKWPIHHILKTLQNKAFFSGLPCIINVFDFRFLRLVPPHKKGPRSMRNLLPGHCGGLRSKRVQSHPLSSFKDNLAIIPNNMSSRLWHNSIKSNKNSFIL